jgi:hypothetical protein
MNSHDHISSPLSFIFQMESWCSSRRINDIDPSSLLVTTKNNLNLPGHVSVDFCVIDIIEFILIL